MVRYLGGCRYLQVSGIWVVVGIYRYLGGCRYLQVSGIWLVVGIYRYIVSGWLGIWVVNVAAPNQYDEIT